MEADIVARLQAAADGLRLCHPDDCRDAVAELNRLRGTVNRQAALIEHTDRLLQQCGGYLAEAKHTIAQLRLGTK